MNRHHQIECICTTHDGKWFSVFCNSKEEFNKVVDDLYYNHGIHHQYNRYWVTCECGARISGLLDIICKTCGRYYIAKTGQMYEKPRDLELLKYKEPLPSDLQQKYFHHSSEGHVIDAIFEKDLPEAFEDPSKYERMVPVKYALAHGYTTQFGLVIVKGSLEDTESFKEPLI